MNTYLDLYMDKGVDFSEIQLKLNSDIFRMNDLKYMTFTKSFNYGDFGSDRTLELYSDCVEILNVFDEEIEQISILARNLLSVSIEDLIDFASREVFDSTVDSLLFTEVGIFKDEKLANGLFYNSMLSAFSTRYLYIHASCLHLDQIKQYLEKKI